MATTARPMAAMRAAGAAALALLACLAAPLAHAQAPLPIFDAHIHYSHDAWDVVPTADVIALMRKAGLKLALVSSSDDEGTQKLYAAAPELIVPSLRPYRSRGELSTWVRDETVIAHLERRLARYRYAAIGEFHLYGADADLPVPRRMVQLAKQHGLILHAHSDADAVERLFRQDPDAKILWAHSGFDRPARVREMMRRHRNLYADLAFRSDHGAGGKVDPEWREAFVEFPDRFTVGTDTFTPERLHYIPEHANWTRGWLSELPRDLAERIAWRNGEALVLPVWNANRAKPLPAASAADPCAEAARQAGTQRIESARLVLVYRTQPEAIAVGKPFAVQAAACPKDAGARVSSFAVDATMPEHRHGMNYAPKVSAAGDGAWRADGLLFHMPGRWQLAFDVAVDGRSERLLRDVTVR